MKPRCYIASPLGFTEAGRHYYAHVFLKAISAVVQPVDPWALTAPADIAAAQAVGRDREMALEIGRRNAEAIRSSELMVAWLDGQELDSGTAAEVGYAAALGIRCFGIRTDLRQSGEFGADVNLQVQTFVEDSGGSVVSGLLELVNALESAVRDASGSRS